MASKVYEFTGEGLWLKGLYEPDPEYDHYSLMINLDDKSQKKFNEAGLKNLYKDNQFGPYGVTFRRPVQKKIKGEVVTFSPPVVTMKKDKSIVEDVRLVGNGSNVTAKVVVYDFSFRGKSGKGSRLESVVINELIPYEPIYENEEELPFE